VTRLCVDLHLTMIRASCCRVAATCRYINSRAAFRALSSKASDGSAAEIDPRKSGATAGWSQWQDDDTMMQSLNEEQVHAAAAGCLASTCTMTNRTTVFALCKPGQTSGRAISGGVVQSYSAQNEVS
jgi:hypothetical protein